MPPFHPSAILRQSQNHTRFISDAKSRIGKCITFGCNQPSQYSELSDIIFSLTRAGRWRKLAVGREGYIWDSEHAGLFRHRIAWGDHDQMGHVNNVVYNFWAETARINWAHNFALRIKDNAEQRAMWDDLVSPRGIGLILRSIKTDYKFPLQYPDRVTVIHKLLEEPKSGMDALHLEAVVLSESHQRIAARITEDIVVYDYRVRKKAPLPESMVDTLKEEWKRQGDVAYGANGAATEIDLRLRKVEQETWDRADAVEDMGAATKRATVKTNEPAKRDEVDETPLEYQVSMQKG